MVAIPLYRAKCIDSDEYIEGFYFNRKNMLGKIIYHKIDFSTTCDMVAEIDPTTLAIQTGKRKMFMSLDIKTGKGGDKISDNKVLVWNDEMMNCSILEIMNNGVIEYEISLDNCDFDKMEVIGIQE